MIAKRKFITKHHLIPRSVGGSNDDWNLLRLNWDEHHEYWHKLFGNRTIFEVIVLLKRLIKMKKMPSLPKGLKYGRGKTS